jgi:DNA repair protein RadC
MLAILASQIGSDLREAIDLDELATLELSTAAQLLGLGVAQASRVLPVIEVGPRTRRVTVRAYKEFLQSRTKNPATR